MRFNVKKGDTKPLRAQLTYASGQPIDLTGAVVTFYMGDTIAGGACTVDDAVNGWVSHAWASGKTDVLGVFNAEFKVLVAGKFERVPSLGYAEIHISASVG